MKVVKVSYPTFTSKDMRMVVEISCTPAKNTSSIELEKYYKLRDLVDSHPNLSYYSDRESYTLEIVGHLPPKEGSIMQFKKWIENIIREVSKIYRDPGTEDKLSKKFVAELNGLLGKEF